MKKLTRDQLKPILVNFLDEFAARHDMPELRVAEGDPARGERPWVPKINTSALIATGEGMGNLKRLATVAPRGQLAALVSRMDVTVTVGGGDSGEVIAVVETSYDHPGGGHNGTTDRYRVAVEVEFGEPRYLGFVHERTYRAIRRQEERA